MSGDGTTQLSEYLSRFRSLFPGNPRIYGSYDPKTKNGFAIKKAHQGKSFQDHLAGRMGLGLAPIMDDNTAQWGVIDIDCHGDDVPKTDLDALAAAIEEKQLPLVVCRSKSGGAHVYLFLSEPAPAGEVKTVVAKWAKWLGYGSSEIFPKQSELAGEGEDLQFPSWINLPYFDAMSTARYAVGTGVPVMDFAGFIGLAESKRVTIKEAKAVQHRIAVGTLDLGEAPPCVAHMIENGIQAGMRNDGFYSVAVYLKRADPEGFWDQARTINANMPDPLSDSELKKVVGSATRRDYKYKCKLDPCKSLCNSAACVERKYGITKSESGMLDAFRGTVFESLTKMATDPVLWKLQVDGEEYVLPIGKLLDFKEVRQHIANSRQKLLPMIKNDHWTEILTPLMAEAEVIEAPYEFTPLGRFDGHLTDFIMTNDLSDQGNEWVTRLSMGCAVMREVDGEKRVYFTSKDLTAYFRRISYTEVAGAELWFMLDKLGVRKQVVKVGVVPLTLFYMPWADRFDPPDTPLPSVEPEI